ncbi:cilia- and flagella-associated protein 36-like [Mercenaria mercenaria]|uniref:cilia- and flagella-associated protein 36-like n=1 Tax=Mercenaria mercenaria TaxID=6596 RepID=UPI00234F73DE|nr:cilia- and flagella-associated protein 36-like [Mercenaria mercenaria]
MSDSCYLVLFWRLPYCIQNIMSDSCYLVLFMWLPYSIQNITSDSCYLELFWRLPYSIQNITGDYCFLVLFMWLPYSTYEIMSDSCYLVVFMWLPYSIQNIMSDSCYLVLFWRLLYKFLSGKTPISKVDEMHWLTVLVVALLLTVYQFIAAAVFQALESGNGQETTPKTMPNINLSEFLVNNSVTDEKKLKALILSVAETYGQGLLEVNETQSKDKWSYMRALCFSVTVVTTVVFDPSVEDMAEYKKIHQEYKQVVEALLDAFTKDTKLTHDEVIQALNDMNSKKDIREVFHGLFELVLAMDDYQVFVRMMTTKNIELQQQALMLIMKTTGALPDSLSDSQSQSQSPPPAPRESEDEIMKRVLEQSKREYEEEQKKLQRRDTKDKLEIQKTIELSKHQAVQLESQRQTEQEKMNTVMQNLVLEDDKKMPPLIAVPAQAKPKEKPVVGTPGISVSMYTEQGSGVSASTGQASAGKTAAGGGTSKAAPGSSQPSVDQTLIGPGLLPMTRVPQISGSQAAANWLKSAQDETSTNQGQSDAVQKAAAAMAGLSAEEIKKRQQYLIAQRDKLIAMKKKEREKQLLSAEQSNPGRPMSARAARQMLDEDKSKEAEQKKTVSDEEQKKIEMRRQIANKLKAELMGDK